MWFNGDIEKIKQEGNKMNWYTRLIGRIGEEDAKGASKHARGRQMPKGWRRAKRQMRKVKKMARRVNR